MQLFTPALTLLAAALPITLAAAVGVTEVEADPNLLFARADPAIGYQLCSAPIVNLYAYSNSNCTTGYLQGSAGHLNSPIYYGLKFAPFKPLQPKTFTSDCKDTAVLTVNDEPAQSLAFSADGVLTDRCKLQVYLLKGCQGEVARSYNLDGFGKGSGVGLCEAEQWRSAKIFCDRYKVNNPPN